MENTTKPPTTAADRYEALRPDREISLKRARTAARITIPALVPPDSSGKNVELEDPFQSVGARGVNSLAGKLLMALFPPNGSFFRYTLDEFVVDELEAQGPEKDDAEGKIDAALGKAERQVNRVLETGGARTKLYEALRQLLVAGNCLLYIKPDGSLALYRLHEYVVKRDMEGNVIDIILKQTISRASASGAVLAALAASGQEVEEDQTNNEDSLEVFTRIQRVRVGGKGRSIWQIHQEVEGVIVPGSEGSYPLTKNPWRPLRFVAIDGEDYGRSFAEEHLGDLLTVEALSRSIVMFAGAASKILYLIDPGGETSPKQLSESPSGDFLYGNAKDITTLMLDKGQDFQVAASVSDKAERRLEQAFLLHTSIQRNAERVTAEEIRYMANELEQGLGGIYSLMSQDLQLPLVTIITHQLTLQKKLPKLPKDLVEPKVVTGLAALGRNSDLMKLDEVVRGIQETFGPEAVSEYVKVGDYVRRRATALGLDTDGFIRSEDEVQAIRKQKTQQALMEKLGPEAMRQGGQQNAQGGNNGQGQ